MKQKAMKSYQSKLLMILLSLITVLAVLASVFDFGIFKASAATDDGAAFQPNEGMTDQTTATNIANEFNVRVEEEGAILLENNTVGEGDAAAPALPLAESERRVTIFGKNSTNMVFGGTGSAGGGTGASITEAMTAGGFQVNPAMATFYNSTSRSGANRVNGSGVSEPRNWSTAETPRTSYTGDTGYNGGSVTASYAEDYRDAAIVVFSRIGGEGFDLLRSMPAGTAGRGDNATQQHYLELDDNEKDLLSMIREAGFQKTIVLLNAGTAVECEALIDPQYGVDAVLWVGFPGGAGLNAIPRILTGEVTPSGHTVDTWEKDFLANPAVQDFSSGGIGQGTTSANGTDHRYNGANNAWGNRYQEGIYLGYRYYETRAYVESLNTTPPAEGETRWSYDDYVRYPFGYGMSYTTFSWEVTNAPEANTTLTADGNISITVNVTNTGEYAGRDVVQLYYNAPYFANGIEKSHVVLGGFAKTDIIQPGESDTVTITMPVREMASYDYSDANGNGFRGYELEAGTYNLYLGTDAHTAWTSSRFSRAVRVAAAASGEFERTATNGANGIAYRTDEVTGNPIVNLFDDVSFGWGWTWDGAAEGQGFRTMSRADFDGTFPHTPTVEERRNANATNRTAGTTPVTVNAAYDTDAPWYTDVEPTQADTAVANADAIVLGDLVGLDKDDPMWDAFLDQMTIAQLRQVTVGSFTMGSRNAVGALGIPQTRQNDGPTGITGQNIPSGTYCRYVSPIVLASTWSVECARITGEMFGSEALIHGTNGHYAPAMNTHRTPFSGRNFEYYSEDGFLGGKMGANVVAGMQSKGSIPAIKHFALNDCEQNRSGIATWATEQTMREIYFKPFEFSVKEGGSLSVMSSYNRIGETHASDNYALLTSLLREEWGFKGFVVTDWYSGANNINAGIRTGNDIGLGNTQAGAPANGDPTASSTTTGIRATHIAALRRAAHNTLYAVANSNAMFRPVAGNVQLVSAEEGTYTYDLRVSRSSTTTNFTYRLASELPEGATFNNGTLTATSAPGVVNVDILVGNDRYATMTYVLADADVPVQIIDGTWWINGEDTGIPVQGPQGPQGPAGENGADGRGIERAEINAAGELILYFTDGTSQNLGVVRGANGADGAQGPAGPAGADGVTPTIEIGENGNWFINGVDTGVAAQGPAGANGADGAQGPAGPAGADGSGCGSVIGIGTGSLVVAILALAAVVLVFVVRKKANK